MQHSPGTMSIEAGISNALPFVTGRCHLTLSLSFPDLPYHSNQICDTNWDIMTMTTRVKCCVHQTLTGPPTFPPSPSPSLFSLFSPLCCGPKPAKHISKWQLLRLASKKPWVVDFPRLMWHLWLHYRIKWERWGPRAQWGFVWGMAGKGSKIRMWRTLAVSRLIQDHWFPASFFLPPGHDLHCKWRFCRFGLFLESEKIGGVERGDRGFPQHTDLLGS